MSGAPRNPAAPARAVPIIDRTAAELERLNQRSSYRNDDALVFGHPELGSVLDTSKLRKRFKDTLTKADVRPVRFHDLRHTFGTQAAAAGVRLRTLQEWMGHRDYKTTLIYADYAPGTHEKALMERAFQPDPLDFRRHEISGPESNDSGRERPDDGDAERRGGDEEIGEDGR